MPNLPDGIVINAPAMFAWCLLEQLWEYQMLVYDVEWEAEIATIDADFEYELERG